MPDIVTSQIFTDGEKGITATKMNNIIGQSVIQPSFYQSKASSATLDPTDQLLELKNTGSYATITGSQLISSISSQVNVTSQITSVRQRSFNAIGNPNFEVAQRNFGNSVTATGFIEDRWKLMVSSGISVTGQSAITGISDPATGFPITVRYLSITLTAQKSTLVAGDYLFLSQIAEGTNLRELMQGNHSISLLVQCSSSLNFGVTMRDSGSSGTATKSLSKLCSYTTPGAWATIQLPNLPGIVSGGNWGFYPGSVGYELDITLASGSTYMNLANDTWQNGNFVGAVGQDNFAALPANTYFNIAMVQHEPGSACTTFIDKPFMQNYEECLRYFCKTYDYDLKPGTATWNGDIAGWQTGTTNISCTARFPKVMANVPTVTIYNPGTGAANSISGPGGDFAVSLVTDIGKGGFNGVNTATMPAVALGASAFFHYTADTGW